MAESRHDIEGVELFPQEEEAVARAVAKRKSEYATGRACVRQALATLGFAPRPVPSGGWGEPLWPAGVVGSITHCSGYRGCAVGRAGEIAAIGIDGEPHAPLPDGLIADVAGPYERAAIARLADAHPDVHWDRLTFSAKEAAYKAWFPLTKRRLGFEDATVTFDAERGTFRVCLPAHAEGGLGGLTSLDGRWLVEDGLVLTATAIRQRSR